MSDLSWKPKQLCRNRRDVNRVIIFAKCSPFRGCIRFDVQNFFCRWFESVFRGRRRVGGFLHSRLVPRWFHRLLQKLQDGDDLSKDQVFAKYFSNNIKFYSSLYSPYFSLERRFSSQPSTQTNSFTFIDPRGKMDKQVSQAIVVPEVLSRRQRNKESVPEVGLALFGAHVALS